MSKISPLHPPPCLFLGEILLYCPARVAVDSASVGFVW